MVAGVARGRGGITVCLERNSKRTVYRRVMSGLIATVGRPCSRAWGNANCWNVGRSWEALITEIMDRMPQSLSAALKAGKDAVVGAGGVTGVGLGILQAWGGIENGQHLFGIICPVCGHLQLAAGYQQAA